MADNAGPEAHPRPLSPHLQIYRWPATMATSIVHRATGVALTVGMAGLAWWLMALASGPDAYAAFTGFARTAWGQFILFGFLWSLCYHFLNGIRHLVWDIGYGFEPHRANFVSVLILAGSIALALAIYFEGLSAMGAL